MSEIADTCVFSINRMKYFRYLLNIKYFFSLGDYGKQSAPKISFFLVISC